MRIALTLGHDASKSEKNDYTRALLEAGFQRDEIVLLPPGSEPEGSFDGVVLGGTLHQDLPSERPSDVKHMVPQKENERRDHAVEVKAGTRLAGIARAK